MAFVECCVGSGWDSRRIYATLTDATNSVNSSFPGGAEEPANRMHARHATPEAKRLTQQGLEGNGECLIDAVAVTGGGKVKLKAADLGEKCGGHRRRPSGRHSVAGTPGLDGRDEVMNGGFEDVAISVMITQSQSVDLGQQ